MCDIYNFLMIVSNTSRSEEKPQWDLKKIVQILLKYPFWTAVRKIGFCYKKIRDGKNSISKGKVWLGLNYSSWDLLTKYFQSMKMILRTDAFIFLYKIWMNKNHSHIHTCGFIIKNLWSNYNMCWHICLVNSAPIVFSLTASEFSKVNPTTFINAIQWIVIILKDSTFSFFINWMKVT